jgi:PIN domain
MNDEAHLIAFLDASVLYPGRLRDLLMHLAMRHLFQPRWSARVQDEWIAALMRDRPDLTAAQLQRTRRLMEEHINDALVSGYEPIVDQLTLPDANDRHVLAAAIHGGAHVVVTANLRDFPADVLSAHHIEAVHPDIFVSRLLEAEPTEVTDAVRELRRDLKNPPFSMAELLALFERIALVKTVAELRRLMES